MDKKQKKILLTCNLLWHGKYYHRDKTKKLKGAKTMNLTKSFKSLLMSGVVAGGVVGAAVGGFSAAASTVDDLVLGLVQHTLPDGAVNMYGTGNEAWINPYFAHLAVYTGIKATEKFPAHRDKVEKMALNWFNWYADHQLESGFIEDFRGERGNYKTTGDYDSTDSYAALYFTALDAYLDMTGKDNVDAKLRKAAEKALAGVEATFEPDGLTFAKPSYRIKYLMDNLEVNVGLQAAVRVFDKLQMPEFKAKAEKMLEANSAAMPRYYSKKDKIYGYALDEQDKNFISFKDYYPDMMANAFAASMYDPPNKEVWLRVTDAARQSLVDNLCCRSYVASLRIGDHATSKAIKAKADQTIAELKNPAELRLDLLYDLIIIELDDPDFWPQIPNAGEER